MSILSIDNRLEEEINMKTLIFSFLAVCALSTVQAGNTPSHSNNNKTNVASRPNTINVDPNGLVTVGSKTKFKPMQTEQWKSNDNKNFNDSSSRKKR